MSTEEDISKLSVWRKKAPKYTTLRTNLLVASPSCVMKIIEKSLYELSRVRSKVASNSIIPHIWQHPLLPEAVSFGSWCNDGDLPRHEYEVIIDCACGAAVLRGAHVFAPGAFGILPGSVKGEVISIYADVGKSCTRGWSQKLNDNDRHFVGNGVLLMDRKQIFNAGSSNQGIAVLVTDSQSGCPSLPPNLIPPGMAVMQNLPSIVCGHIVDPQPGEVILEMCAAPGNKTTHLAALMKNKGIIIALDRSSSRISKLRKLCDHCGVENVTAFTCNSITAVKSDSTLPESNEKEMLLKNGPPFSASSFDRILLDAPCSGLGLRPKLEPIDFKHTASFPLLQRKLFRTAVKLLKPNGMLVYSTCTIMVEENEEIVRWALDQNPCLALLPAEPRLFSPVSDTDSINNILSLEEKGCVQKFVPSVNGGFEENLCEKDTVGFFIARFLKRL